MIYVFATDVVCASGLAPVRCGRRIPCPHVVEVHAKLDPDDGTAWAKRVLLLAREGGRGRPRDITAWLERDRQGLLRDLENDALREYARDREAERWAANESY